MALPGKSFQPFVNYRRRRESRYHPVRRRHSQAEASSPSAPVWIQARGAQR